MNRTVFFLICFFAFATSFLVGVPAESLAQETYLKSNKTCKISNSKRIVMTPFVVKSNKAVLRWNARALQSNSTSQSKAKNRLDRLSNAKNQDGSYCVYVSTTGNSAKSFTDKPILKVTAENSAWTRHSVSLSRYAGKKIWVAFVCTNGNRSTIYLNELYAGVPSSTYLLADAR